MAHDGQFSTMPADRHDDLLDLALVLVRAVTDTGRQTSLEEVAGAFGHTRESLAKLPDDESPTG